MFRGGRGGGGRGGGRGGGFGGRGAPTGPVAVDEDGTVLQTHFEGPPPTFPETELPDHPEVTAKDKLLMILWKEALQRIRVSPYYLEKEKEAKDGPEAVMESYMTRGGDAAGMRPKRKREPLSSVMTLVPEYVPEELYSTQEKKAASRAQALRASGKFWKGRSDQDDGDDPMANLEKMAKRELALGDKEGGDEKAEEADAGAEEAHLLAEEEEEDEEVGADYYQGANFDDDDEYGDDYDDGGGGGGEDGPYF